jgi:hypothetical protein
MGRSPSAKPSVYGTEGRRFESFRMRPGDQQPTKTEDPAGIGVDVDERTFRIVVCAGLWPLLDAVVRGPRGVIVPVSRLERHALVMLGLAVFLGQPIATFRGREVHQQMAAHQVLHPATVHPEAAKEWIGILVVAGKPTYRGAMMQGWLALGLLPGRCYACEAMVTGIADHRRAGGAVELACGHHRYDPALWGPLEQHLAGMEEVGHG